MPPLSTFLHFLAQYHSSYIWSSLSLKDKQSQTWMGYQMGLEENPT